MADQNNTISSRNTITMFKKSILFIALVVLSTTSWASFSLEGIQDSTVKKNKWRTINVGVNLGKKDNYSDQDSMSNKRKSRFSYGITFSRVDLGFSRLVDNGSFTLSPQNDFLKYDGWKTSTFGFDLLQFGYRFNSSFKVYLSAGIDWTHLRLKKNITIRPDAPTLTYDTSAVNFSKNRFSSTYLRIPLSFELRTKADDRGKSFRFIFGPDAGFLLNGKVKQVSKENGKQKVNDDYHFTKFRYGAFGRIAYGDCGLFVKYYMNDTFENSPNQEGLRTMSFGLTFGL